jgi:hypothetical protein
MVMLVFGTIKVGNRHLVKADLNQQPRIVSNFKYIGTKIAIDFQGTNTVYSGALNLCKYNISNTFRSY